MLDENITITLPPPAVRVLYLALRYTQNNTELLGEKGCQRAHEMSAYLVARFPEACGIQPPAPEPAKALVKVLGPKAKRRAKTAKAS